MNKVLTEYIEDLKGSFIGRINDIYTRSDFSTQFTRIFYDPYFIWRVISEDKELRESYLEWLRKCKIYDVSPSTHVISPASGNMIYLNPYDEYLKKVFDPGN